MSHGNVEVVRWMYDAYASGDFETALAYLDPEIEMDLTLRPDGGVFRGHDGVAEAVRTWLGAWEDWRLEVEEIVDLGDRVLVLARESGRGRGSGIEIEHPNIAIATVRNGKIVHTKGFVDRGQALEPPACGSSSRSRSELGALTRVPGRFGHHHVGSSTQRSRSGGTRCTP